MFDYQKTMFDAFEEVDENGVPTPVWIKKATGLGATTLGIRYLVVDDLAVARSAFDHDASGAVDSFDHVVLDPGSVDRHEVDAFGA